MAVRGRIPARPFSLARPGLVDLHWILSMPDDLEQTIRQNAEGPGPRQLLQHLVAERKRQ
jgi:hypothetical protein